MASSNPAERKGDLTPPTNSEGHRGPLAPEDSSLGVWLASNAMTLIIAVGLIGWLSWRMGPAQVVNIALAAVALGFVVFIHELGHFLVAKWCDVHVEVFSIGFGPALPGCSFQRGETTYKLALFPLGGYVKMVGEGTETEEDDADPRSFKNKTVGQRMAIISAGVILNIVLAAVCFVVVYMGHGIERPAAIIGGVDARSPAWQKGVPSGSVIRQIGSVRDPFYDDVMPEVTNSTEGQQILLVYEAPGEPDKPYRTMIEPRKEKSDSRPLIGIVMIDQPRLIPKKGGRVSNLPPVWLGSAAAQAEPPFEYGDVIVGMTDPAKPDQVTLLPPDPRHPDDPSQVDILEMRRRLDDLAGKEITFLVKRDKKDASPDEMPISIKVPPAYHFTLGLRMRMGQVTSIREDSPAARAGVQARNVMSGEANGDIIKEVEVTNADGTKTRWVSARSKDVPAGIVEKDLDPMRLPSELQQWASGQPKDRTVRLKVLRKVGHAERQEVALSLDWDDRWRHDRATPLTRSSPLPINELGLAYRVETVIDAVQPDSPAAKAGLRKGDFIKGIRFYKLTNPKEEPVADAWNEIQGDQWAQPATLLSENYDVKKVDLKVERDNETFEVDVTAVPDPTWPLSDRGLILANEVRLHKADNAKEALTIGAHRTVNTIKQIYLQLRALLTGRVSVEMLGGPIQIAKTSYLVASMGYWELLNWMALISVNLAVINFLPIPVLDGGHMVFLIYEGLRGRPASEPVRAIVTYAGLMLIVSLMAFVTILDVKRW